MYILIKSILLFFAKVVLIEWIIELCRSMVYWIQYRTFPEKFFLEDENRFLHWAMNGIESACVVLLLYLDFNVYFIIVFTFFLTYSIQKLGKYLLSR